MDPVRQQYEAYPYPARDPKDEAKRLIEGSPSHPVEIDHYLFQGRRDWTQPLRALVAGGGTGDGLIMLAQKLADIGCPAEVTYLDMSEASRDIAEARAKARGLDIRFITGDLLTAPEYGPFDYIDCCGVLHHLPDPDAGFAALARALSPEGGMGLMVYAPYGRSGVYPLQDAFGALLGPDTPADKIRMGKAALASLPDSHPFKVNAHLRDHNDSDAGFHDLLLHSRDRAYTIIELNAVLDKAGLGLVSPVESIRYDPACYLPDTPEMADRIKALNLLQRMAVAEQLAGNLKTHVVYAAPKSRAAKAMARPTKPDLIPRLTGVAPGALAKQIMDKGRMTASFDGVSLTVPIPKDAGVMLGRVNNARTLGQMSAGEDWMAFSSLWGPVHRALTGFNLLHYSTGASR